MDRQDSQEGLRVTLAEMEKVPLAKDPNVIFNILCKSGSWPWEQKGRSTKQ